MKIRCILFHIENKAILMFLFKFKVQLPRITSVVMTLLSQGGVQHTLYLGVVSHAVYTLLVFDVVYTLISC